MNDTATAILEALLDDANKQLNAMRREVSAMHDKCRRYDWWRDGEMTQAEFDEMRTLCGDDLDAHIDAKLGL